MVEINNERAKEEIVRDLDAVDKKIVDILLEYNANDGLSAKKDIVTIFWELWETDTVKDIRGFRPESGHMPLIRKRDELIAELYALGETDIGFDYGQGYKMVRLFVEEYRKRYLMGR